MYFSQNINREDCLDLKAISFYAVTIFTFLMLYFVELIIYK